MTDNPEPNELKLTRDYDAPLQVVWDAWTDPDQVSQWWGPRGFSLTTHSRDLRPGGHWHYTMHGPDGTDYPNKTSYHEVDERTRLVYDHGANDEQPALFRVTVLFAAIGDRTRMEMTMRFRTPEERAEAMVTIKDAGGNSTWDRLAEYLAKLQLDEEVFIINRSFDAPADLVFDLWTDPDHVSRWLGPEGSAMEYFEREIGEGKTTFYKMSSDGGMLLYGKIHYRKIDRPSYLEYAQVFCDEAGELTKHPMVPVWPDVMRTRVFFVKEGDNQTRVTLTWQPDGKVTDQELAEFADMRGSMTQGWTQSFDKLEALVGAGHRQE